MQTRQSRTPDKVVSGSRHVDTTQSTSPSLHINIGQAFYLIYEYLNSPAFLFETHRIAAHDGISQCETKSFGAKLVLSYRHIASVLYVFTRCVVTTKGTKPLMSANKNRLPHALNGYRYK